MVFRRHKVQQVLKQVLKERMEGQQYDPVKGAQVGVFRVHNAQASLHLSFVGVF